MAEKSIATLVIETAVNDKGYKDGMKDLYQEISQDDQKITNRKGVNLDKAYQKALGLGKGLTSVANSIAKAFYNVAGTIGLVGGALGGLGALGFILDKAFDRAFGSSEKFKANLQYIGFVASKMIENFLNPAIEKTREIIEKIVNGLVKIIQYVGYILSALSGRNVFEGTGVNDFKKSLDKTDKSAKQLKKDLMGFDEVNRLSDNGTADSFVAPSFEIKGLEETEVPGWLKWIVENGPLVKDILLAIAGGIIAVKLGMEGLQGLGISLMIFGIIQGIKDVKELMEDPSWKNFGKVISDLGLIVAGFGMVIGNLPLVVAGALLIIDGYLIQHYNEVMDYLDGLEQEWDMTLDDIVKNGQWYFAWLLEILSSPIRAIKSQFEGIFTCAKNVFDGIIAIAQGDFSYGLQSIFFGLINAIIGKVNALIDAINGILSPVYSLMSQLTGNSYSDMKLPHLQMLEATPTIRSYSGHSGGGSSGGGIHESNYQSNIGGFTQDDIRELGKSIADNMTINVTNVNEMNGRTLSRNLVQIVNDKLFGSNR